LDAKDDTIDQAENFNMPLNTCTNAVISTGDGNLSFQFDNTSGQLMPQQRNDEWTKKSPGS